MSGSGNSAGAKFGIATKIAVHCRRDPWELADALLEWGTTVDFTDGHLRTLLRDEFEVKPLGPKRIGLLRAASRIFPAAERRRALSLSHHLAALRVALEVMKVSAEDLDPPDVRALVDPGLDRAAAEHGTVSQLVECMRRDLLGERPRVPRVTSASPDLFGTELWDMVSTCLGIEVDGGAGYARLGQDGASEKEDWLVEIGLVGGSGCYFEYAGLDEEPSVMVIDERGLKDILEATSKWLYGEWKDHEMAEYVHSLVGAEEETCQPVGKGV